MKKVLYYITFTAIWLLSLLPLWMLYGLSDLVYVLIYYVIGYRRKLVFKNMSDSFPEKTAEEVRELEQRFYHWFCDCLLESIKLLTISKKQLKPMALVLREILITNTTTASEMESAGGAESEAEMRRIAEAIKYSVIIVSTFPMLCLYPFAQKYFAKGVMLGAIKG